VFDDASVDIYGLISPENEYITMGKNLKARGEVKPPEILKPQSPEPSLENGYITMGKNLKARGEVKTPKLRTFTPQL